MTFKHQVHSSIELMHLMQIVHLIIHKLMTKALFKSQKLFAPTVGFTPVKRSYICNIAKWKVYTCLKDFNSLSLKVRSLKVLVLQKCYIIISSSLNILTDIIFMIFYRSFGTACKFRLFIDHLKLYRCFHLETTIGTDNIHFAWVSIMKQPTQVKSIQ